MRIFTTGVLVLIAGLALWSVALGARDPDPPPGKAPFERVCAPCHGEKGQGEQGPALVPMEFEFDDFIGRVRAGGGEMPPISKNAMSDEEVKQVYDYLKSLSPK